MSWSWAPSIVPSGHDESNPTSSSTKLSPRSAGTKWLGVRLAVSTVQKLGNGGDKLSRE
jgi:hypothetical protein